MIPQRFASFWRSWSDVQYVRPEPNDRTFFARRATWSPTREIRGRCWRGNGGGSRRLSGCHAGQLSAGFAGESLERQMSHRITRFPVVAVGCPTPPEVHCMVAAMCGPPGERSRSGGRPVGAGGGKRVGRGRQMEDKSRTTRACVLCLILVLCSSTLRELFFSLSWVTSSITVVHPTQRGRRPKAPVLATKVRKFRTSESRICLSSAPFHRSAERDVHAASHTYSYINDAQSSTVCTPQPLPAQHSAALAGIQEGELAICLTF
nr:hypothetical protein CFP56_56952 [Quercus suber]